MNSLRVRLPQVLAWLDKEKPDILALQETKLPDEDFPLKEIEAAGYHVVYSGQRKYNGVAILSRKAGADKVTDFPDFHDPQRRIVGVTVGDVRILNLYVPNGESVDSSKYQYKMTWLEKLKIFLQEELKKYPKLVVLGDFNIAPDERDVHDPTIWEGRVLFSQRERDALSQILKLGFLDCFRVHSQDEKIFSWWDYRLNSFKRNLGLRIDLILASSLLSCTACYIDKIPRGFERPSDHTPVIASFLT